MSGQVNRADILGQVRRVVVKVGSAVLTSGHGGLDEQRIQGMCDDISRAMARGYQVVLVSSGAIAAGTRKIGLRRKPKSIPEKQAAAAVGQARLMWMYERCFGSTGRKVAQILLTREDLAERRRFLNARNTLFTLIRWGILPIINENDTVVTEEIQFGDNDCLSALVTNLVQAELLVILTDTDGLFDKDPKAHPEAKHIAVVQDVDERIFSMVELTTSEVGTGGMISKLQASRTASVYGVPTVITSGARDGVLERVLKGEELGTLVLPKENRINSWKHWIAYSRTVCGALVVDQGARKAVVEKGKSLLPSGIKEVRGNFGAGDSVSCLGENGVEFARGLVNYSSEELRRIQGSRTSEIESILGYKYFDEVIHRDDLVIIL